MSATRTEPLLRLVDDSMKPLYEGRVEVVSGVMVEAVGVPAALGELCCIHRTNGDPVDAEVIGFRSSQTLLMPHGDLRGIAPDQRVTALRRPFEAPVGDAHLGRVLAGFGAPSTEVRPPRPRVPAPCTRTLPLRWSAPPSPNPSRPASARSTDSPPWVAANA